MYIEIFADLLVKRRTKLLTTMYRYPVSELYIFNFNLSNLMLPSVAFHIYLFRLLLEMKSLKRNKCMSKSLLTIFSAWVIVHGRKYSYNLKLAQIYENVLGKFCKFLASFLT